MDMDNDKIIRSRVEEAMDLLTWGGRRPASDASEDELRDTMHTCAVMCVEDVSRVTAKGGAS